MQLEQAFELPVAPASAWGAFQDIGLLVDCLPGASLTGPEVDGAWPLRFDVKLGPIAAAFAGSGRVSFDQATRAGRFEGQAADKRTQSRVKGVAAFRLGPVANGTQVQVTVDYALTGSLAQFSRGGIVRELATALTDQFASNLAARLAQAEPAALAGQTEAPTPASAAPAASIPPQAAQARGATAPLSASGLIVLVLKARWQRLLARVRGQAAP